MQRPDVWSLSLGRWGRVYVRLHMFFLLFATFTFYLGWRESLDNSEMTWIGLQCIVILALSVLAHELGHYYTSVQLGNPMDTIVLGPLGGLRAVQINRDPQGQLLAVLAGPLTSLTIVLLCLVAITYDGRTIAIGLLNPLAPHDPLASGVNGNFVWLLRGIRLTCWINWLLLVVNLIPAFPFDGGMACTSFLMSIRREMKFLRAITIVSTLAKIVAVLLLLSAWFVRDWSTDSFFPSWLALMLLSIFVLFSARSEESQLAFDVKSDAMFGYDFSEGYTSLERSTSETVVRRGIFSRWMDTYRATRLEKKIASELKEDRHMDEVLSRLHEVGYENLSVSERSLLQRVSARYRDRDH